jgi:DNA modification methylase
MRILHGDCLEVMKDLEASSVDACVTDPPYGLSFMGKDWDHGVPGVAFWAEVIRVLKPGGHMLAFGGTRTYHRLACAIEDAGFEIRDQVQWLYGSGFPKSHDVSKGIDKAAGATREVIGTAKGKGGENLNQLAREGGNDSDGANGVGAYGQGAKQTTIDIPVTRPATPEAAEWEGWGTALKPAFEPIVLARKPLSEKTVAANVLKWRTGALNIGGCRVPGEIPTSFPKRRTPKDDYVYEAGFHKTSEETAEASPLGRWPANVVTDGSAEVVGMFPSQNSGKANPNLKRHAGGGVIYGECDGGQPKVSHGDSGSAARFFYSAKASKQDRNGSKHPTVKPINLLRYLCRLITPPGGIVLDPFAGSGTTGEAAVLEGFNPILIEQEAEYIADIERRMAEVLAA